MGLLFFILIYGIEPVIFTNDYFVINGYIEKDLSQHYSGWMLYRNSPWQFPLGIGQNIAYPYGNAVSFTDSIPLMAIFFKLFSGILPDTFQYFGLWVMLCYILQGGYGALLASKFNKDYVVNMLSAIVFLLTPVMIERAFRHCGLTAHFLILAALYYYFENKGQYSSKAFIPFIIINALSITIHPYMMPFTFAIMFAYCAELFVINKKFKKSIGYLLGSIAITLGIGFAIGAFSVGGGLSSLGYGSFSMNLNAFYNPVSKGFENWSRVLSEKPLFNLQIEGFSYLGLGIILFIPISVATFVITQKKFVFDKAFTFIKNYFGIIFSVTALFVFAIGDVVRFGGLELFRIPFPSSLVNGIFGIYRANGRFGWLLIYMISLFIIYALSLTDKKAFTVFALILLIGVQTFDISDALISKYNYFHYKDGDIQAQQVTNVLQNSFWDELSQEYDYAFMIADCIPGANFEVTSKFAKADKAVNTRFDIKIDEDKFRQVEQETLWMISNNSLPDEYAVMLHFIPDKYKEGISSGDVTVFYVDNVIIVCNNRFTSQQIDNFTAEGNFEILEYPYTVQAELDFKAEYGL
ncbi:MAG: hypothetical protein IKU54_06565 [Oscillospiraceae bacterium]|nr:hypothetical protein [Oscillospiraceae bacterium]